MKKLHGVHTPHWKNTAACPAVRIPVPPEVIVPMSMHIGAPAKPLVKVNDEVRVGQVIAEAGGFVSAPIHSGVSGKVKKIDEVLLSSGMRGTAIIIETDGEQTVSEDVKPVEITSKAELIDAARNCGLVGLGGAAFPASVKLAVKDEVKIDYLLINGAECEPYITSDTRTMIDDAELIVKGAELVKKFVGIQNVVFGIENNKQECISKISGLVQNMEGFSVKALPAMYPQGGEKVLIYNITGREVPEGKLPADAGCIVMNCTSLAALYRYVSTGMP
ncbi:MAG: RnfABCDGE type electron transport complex subunit C, partial [Parasporobacterium sp.]|nr:RnfABCDGE type electron transport complex subunit C [Parasporobacterium sp.]